MANTLQEIREQKGITSCEKVFRRMLLIAGEIDLDPERVPPLRTLARMEKKDVADVDPVVAQTYLWACGTDLETELPDLAARAERDARILVSKFGGATSRYAVVGSDLLEQAA